MSPPVRESIVVNRVPVTTLPWVSEVMADGNIVALTGMSLAAGTEELLELETFPSLPLSAG